MADATAESMKLSISKAFETYMSELKQSATHWDRRPAADAEGEDAWCARQVAEHIASAGPYFGKTIAKVAGLPEPALERVELPWFEEAVPVTENGHAALMGVVSKLTDEQLALAFQSPQFGDQTLGGVVGMVAYHLNDHAQQLKTLRG